MLQNLAKVLTAVILVSVLWVPDLLAVEEKARGDVRAAQAEKFLKTTAQYGLSGVLLLAADGEILFHSAAGEADKENGIPNTTDTYFDIASIAKTFTGAAILLAEEDGVLRTRDSLESYLGLFPDAKKGATIHHLATHKAGLVARGYGGLAGDNIEAYVASVKSAPLESVPGENYRYTNAGTSLLAAVLEIATEQTWESFLRQRLFDPAGMEAYFFPDLHQIPGPVARGYAGPPGNISSEVRNELEWGARGATGVYARAVDLNAWVDKVLRGTLLSPASRAKVMDASEIEAYGWHDQTDSKGRRVVHKGGDSVEYTSQILYYPEQDVTIIWVVNDNQQRWRSYLNRSLTAIMYGEVLALPEEIAPLPEEISGLAGDYWNEVNGGIRIDVLEDRLWVTGEGFRRPLVLYPIRDNFFSGLDGSEGVFIQAEFNADGVSVTLRSAEKESVVYGRSRAQSPK